MALRAQATRPCFPQAIGMAATFDKQLVGKMGETIGVEARAKYNQAMHDDVHARYFGLTVWSAEHQYFFAIRAGDVARKPMARTPT